jgi:hypothetical protein
MVVDGVPESEKRQHCGEDGRGRSIFAIEVARLDAANSRLRRGSLWELGVECDEGAEI